jgi:hypothetical protein
LQYKFEKDLEASISILLSSKRCNKCYSKFSKNCEYDMSIKHASQHDYRVNKILYNSTLNRPITDDMRFPLLDNSDIDCPLVIRDVIKVNKADSKCNMATITFTCSKCFYTHTITKAI